MLSECGGMKDDEYDLSPRDAALLLGIHVDTLKRWAADGTLPSWKTPGGWWRFSTEQLLEWRDARKAAS
jgi:excisionase family DNA binding protein